MLPKTPSQTGSVNYPDPDLFPNGSMPQSGRVSLFREGMNKDSLPDILSGESTHFYLDKQTQTKPPRFFLSPHDCPEYPASRSHRRSG
jgi:hypothetical protein